MFNELYENLNVSEKENFKKIVNILLSKNFLVYRDYDYKNSDFKTNPDYRFVDRQFELFKNYFSFSGWKLCKDQNYDVIWIENELGLNRTRLDKNTTLMLYTLRLMYEEKRETISLNTNAVFTISELIKKMMQLEVINKKMPDIDIRNSLSKIINFNIIQKIDGNLDNKTTRLLILPSILFVLTNDNISKLNDNLKEIKNSSKEDTQEEFEKDDEIVGDE